MTAGLLKVLLRLCFLLRGLLGCNADVMPVQPLRARFVSIGSACKPCNLKLYPSFFAFSGHSRIGATITKVYYCPHEKEPPCNCRKPAPGMLLTAAKSHSLDLVSSWMIGDSDIDVEAGRKAGCKTIRSMQRDAVGNCGVDVSAASLLAAVHRILALDL